MILITGAAGKTGRAVISALIKKQADIVRALVLNETEAKLASQEGAKDIVMGDLLDANLVQKAVKGVQAIYHICPNMHPAETQIGKIIIASAIEEGIHHFVYHSVLHPQIEKMPHHWNKLKVEELLFESGLPFTILQPSPYMQNLLASWQTITEKGVYSNPYPVLTRLSLIDLKDVGEIAAKVLIESDHIGAIYELVGTLPLTQTRVAEIFSQKLNRPVIAKELPLDGWRNNAESSGSLTKYAIETLLKMFTYYANYGLGGNPSILAYLLNRTPTSLSDFVARVNALGQ